MRNGNFSGAFAYFIMSVRHSKCTSAAPNGRNLILMPFMKICHESPSLVTIGHYTWRLKDISILLAVLSSHKNALFKWNGTVFLGQQRRYKHYANVSHCNVIPTLPISFKKGTYNGSHVYLFNEFDLLNKITCPWIVMLQFCLWIWAKEEDEERKTRIVISLTSFPNGTRQANYVWRKVKVPSLNNYCRSEAINITYAECVSVAFIIQHAKRMRRIILSSMACFPLQYFSTLSDIRQDFRKKVVGHIMCAVIFLKALSEIRLTLRIIQRDIIINVRISSRKSPVNELEFSWHIFEI